MGTWSRNSRVRIRGRIVEGLRAAGNFTQISWVRKQFISKLSIDPFPGTLNLEIVDLDSLQAFNKLKATRGIEIQSEDSSFCNAQCYPVFISGLLEGAIVFPLVEDYLPIPVNPDSHSCSIRTAVPEQTGHFSRSGATLGVWDILPIRHLSSSFCFFLIEPPFNWMR